MIDLAPFCGTERSRPYLSKPFSRGDFTYATNGKICVRVPRIADVPEQQMLDITKLPWDKGEGFEAAEFTIPAPLPPETIECDCFDGKMHNCPDCDCECERCGGTGKVTLDPNKNRSIELCGLSIPIRYARLIQTLPNLQIGKVKIDNPDADYAIYFKFDGGDGILMPMKGAEHE